MSFKRPSLIEITKRIEKDIESRLFGGTALLRRAVLRVLARVFAGAIHTSYGFINSVVEQLFVATATDTWLDRLGLLWGVNKKAGSFATGTATFNGNIGSVIPIETKIQNDGGIEYATLTEEILATTSINIEIQAIESGEDANYKVDSVANPLVLSLVSPLAGIDNEINVYDSVTGGQTVENDEDYRKRILQHIQFPPMGGNKADYIEWGLSVDGVSQAWCYPLANGPGTVTVVVTAQGADPTPSPTLLTDVNTKINEVKPITSTISAVSITDSNGNNGFAKVKYVMKITPYDTQIEDNIKKNISDLLYPIEPGSVIKLSQVRGAITAAGTRDYTITGFTVDSSNKNIEDYILGGFVYPMLEDISFSEKI